VLWGPDDPKVTPMFAAVKRYTRTDDVVAFMRARAMTLYTDRRAVQSSDLAIIVQRADYFAMLRGSSFSQPNVATAADGSAAGLSIVWQDDSWVLWKITHAM
jgi:hypothetical protein